MKEIIELSEKLAVEYSKTVSLNKGENFTILRRVANDIEEIEISQEAVAMMAPMLDCYYWFEREEVDNTYRMATVGISKFKADLNSLIRTLLISEALKEL